MIQNIHTDVLMFVIDTDTYAGNFERQLCAHMTGQIGDCDVGILHTKKFKDEESLEDFSFFVENITSVPDEHGTYRPVSIYPTPGFWNDGLGNEWPDSMWGSDEAIKKHAESSLEHGVSYPLVKHPSYQSVAIFFHKETVLSGHIDLLIRRARSFKSLKQFDSSPKNILGYRLIQPVLEIKTLKSWSAIGNPII